MAKVAIEGYASTSDMDYARHVVAPGAFGASIRQKGLDGPKGIKLLFAHDDKKPLGAITKLEQRNGGLWLEGFIEDSISYGKDVAVASKAAGGLSYSVGFYLIDADIEETPDGREYLHILKGELFEVSVVVFPCNSNAMMTAQEKAGDPLERALASLAKLNLALADTKTKPTDGLSDQIAAMRRIFAS